MNIIDEIENSQKKPKSQIPWFNVGDTVRVHFRIVEGEKERIQIFEGVVIGRDGGESGSARFTVRRVVYNEGVERIFPLHSPRVEKVEVVREGRVRRAKLNYLRDRSGKDARVKALGREAAQKAAAAAEEAAQVAAKEEAAIKAAADSEAAKAEEAAAEAEAPAEEAQVEASEEATKED